MKIDTMHSSKPRSSFIIEFVWLSLVCGLVAIWGCSDLGQVVMRGPGAADAVEYAEARQQAMKDPEVIEADRKYKNAHSEWLKVHQELIAIDEKYLASWEHCKIDDEPYGYSDKLPESSNPLTFSEKDNLLWNLHMNDWTRLRNENNRLLDEWEELVDKKAKQIVREQRLRQISPLHAEGCFTTDTLVLMESGFKRIADIKAGDRLRTLDPAGNLTVSTVAKHYVFTNNHYYLINGNIKVTALHRFYTLKGWIRARDLKKGDRIQMSDGSFEEIISKERFSADLAVYNLGIADNHNFFVSSDGKKGYLVHNCEGGDRK